MHKEPIKFRVGVDEVNYSPSIAGDCIVCALAAKRRVEGVKDSKELTHKARLRLFKEIQASSYYVVVPASVNMISQIGIYRARNLAAKLALRGIYELLTGRVSEVIFDGPLTQQIVYELSSVLEGVPVKPLVDADKTIYEVSAASIVAKVYADALFFGFGSFWPGYGMEQDHGSPSGIHIEALKTKGPSPFHRFINYAPKWWQKILKGG